jgi:hypothetical protein
MWHVGVILLNQRGPDGGVHMGRGDSVAGSANEVPRVAPAELPYVLMSDQELLQALETGPCQRFSDWPNSQVPKVAAGVYTIWERSRFIYVGMSGRTMTSESVDAPDEPAKAKGLWTRLGSHASGRRSGDQFCVYICDRFVVPRLSVEQQAQVATGVLSLDALTRSYVQDRLCYRFATLRNGKEAFALERDLQRGAMSVGKPFLNPL